MIAMLMIVTWSCDRVLGSFLEAWPTADQNAHYAYQAYAAERGSHTAAAASATTIMRAASTRLKDMVALLSGWGNRTCLSD
jgi:hypothetical protein